MSDTNDTPRFRFSNLARVRLRRRNPPAEPDPDDPSTPLRPRRRRRKRCSFSSDPNTRVGVYVAMAHAGLVLTLAILFALVKLLQGYWRPIQWAILCSMPLRELHISLVSFWSHSLRLGLLPSVLAVPLATLHALSASLLSLFHLLRRPSARHHLGFPDLVQWLVSFAIFLFAYEHVGLLCVPLLLLPCFVAYASGYNPSPLSQVIVPEIQNSPFFTIIGRGRLKTMVGVGLILMLVVGSMLGFFFFSYKIGVEGKEAVLSLKEHMDRNNYPARIGLSKWMDEKHILDLIDAYSTNVYDTVSHNIHQLAKQYNVTHILDGVKHDFTKPQTTRPKNVSREVNFRSSLQSKSKSMDWKVIYRDKDYVFRELMKLIGREHLRERVKVLLLQSIDVTKQVVGSVTMILVGGANLLLFMAVSILYGAAEVVNIIYEVTVFIWLLYYLMTTETGGVMDHVTGMLPVAKGTRERCGQVLDEAVKSVLVAAAKMAFFQGCWTYLLFRFYRIHFLYVSTLVAIVTGVLPIVPCWIASIPAAAQLAVEGKYVEAIALTTLHFLVLEYGTIHIQQDEIPAHNAYLTGLSIFGGIALFPSYFEGAIMGPLLMTVMIALKNLYVEFVLASTAAIS